MVQCYHLTEVKACMLHNYYMPVDVLLNFLFFLLTMTIIGLTNFMSGFDKFFGIFAVIRISQIKLFPSLGIALAV